MTFARSIGRATGMASRVARRAVRSLCPGPVILLYHRVTDLATDPQLLAVSPTHFEEHLDVLRARTVPMPLRELAAASISGRAPQRAVAITFDDGYGDNFREALPLLERHGIPATVFVTSNFAGTSQEFFWDELERLILREGPVPQTLRVEFDGGCRTFDFRDEQAWNSTEWHRHRAWNVLLPATSRRHRAYIQLCDRVRSLPPESQVLAIDNIRQQIDASSTGRPTHYALTPDEVRRLARSGIVTVGSHTCTHPRLSCLEASDEFIEVSASRRTLEEMTGSEVRTFSYPYGTPADYTVRSVAAVRSAGYTYACANVPGSVRRSTSPFELPRIIVRDWTGEELEKRLEKWFCT